MIRGTDLARIACFINFWTAIWGMSGMHLTTPEQRVGYAAITFAWLTVMVLIEILDRLNERRPK